MEFWLLEIISPEQVWSLCVRSSDGVMQDHAWEQQGMEQDGVSCQDAMVRSSPFLSAGLWSLCPDPTQQAAAPAGTDQPADQQGDEDACWGRKPFQVGPGL